MNQNTPGILNPKEAPLGYYAVLKTDAKPKDGSNICRACDWRPHCNGLEYRCSPHDIRTKEGKTLTRNDGCSVLFKALPGTDSSARTGLLQPAECDARKTE